MNKYDSPEEKLLNLIKKKKHSRPEAEDNKQSGQEKQKKSVPWEMLMEDMVLFDLKSYSFDPVVKLLILGFVVVFAYSVFVFFGYFSYDSRLSLNKFEVDTKIEFKTEKDIFELKPLAYYSDVIGKRKLFKLYEKPQTINAGPVAPKNNITIQNLLSNIKLLGIIWDEGRPQAIIEDRKSRSTLYVVAGDTVGELRVDRIEAGMVVLSYNDETAEIKM